MTNLHLEPGEGTLEDLLADVDEGVYMETNRSWSIDDKRLNFQFGTQIAWEIKDGKLGRMLRDATYTGITPQFWGSLDAVAGRDSWRLYGMTNCGKGQPGQSAHVSHGAAPARFRERAGRGPVVNALDVGESARSIPAGGEAEAVAHVEHSGLARFAGSEVHQPTLIENAMVTLRVVARQSRRRRDDEQDRRAGLAELARRAADAAESSPPDESFPGLAPPADPPDVEGYDEETAALGPGDQARLAAAAIDAGGDVPVYGFFTSAVSELAVVSSTGLSVHQRMTDATALVVAADENGSGYAEQTAWRAGGIDPSRRRAGGRREGAANERRRGDRARRVPRSARAVRVRRPARLLLARLVRRARTARQAQLLHRPARSEGLRREDLHRRRRARSPRAAEGVRLRGHAEAARAARGRRRRPQRRLGPCDGGTGRRRRGVHRPRAARRTARLGPLPSALSVSPGAAESVEELAELVGDGLYITRLHYLGVVHPREGIITGMTRDGTFRIRDGKIAEPLVNLRFTVAVPDFLRDVLGLTNKAALVNSQNFYGERYPYGVMAPADRVGALHRHGRRLEARDLTAE